MFIAPFPLTELGLGVETAAEQKTKIQGKKRCVHLFFVGLIDIWALFTLIKKFIFLYVDF